MRVHNICFLLRNKKIIFELSSAPPLIWSSVIFRAYKLHGKVYGFPLSVHLSAHQYHNFCIMFLSSELIGQNALWFILSMADFLAHMYVCTEELLDYPRHWCWQRWWYRQNVKVLR